VVHDLEKSTQHRQRLLRSSNNKWQNNSRMAISTSENGGRVDSKPQTGLPRSGVAVQSRNRIVNR
jgi:hypothetical protein